MVINESKGKNACVFCNGNLTCLGKCVVCENCKTIARVSEIKDSTIIENTEKTIESIQDYLSQNLERLHDIEQRYIARADLTNEEKSIIDYCFEFQNCRSWINTLIQNRISIGDIVFREKLYQLLSLSQQFKQIFNEECIEFSMYDD